MDFIPNFSQTFNTIDENEMTCDYETFIEKMNINNIFKLPIYYLEKKESLNKVIVDDLELIKSKDKTIQPIYSYYLNSNNFFSSCITTQCVDYFTTDTEHLNDTQNLLQELNSEALFSKSYDTDILTDWNEIKNNPSFLEKYQFIDWSHLDFLNKSELFLQLMSIYSLLSPIISFVFPIIILLIPFFYIRTKGLELTLNEYLDILTGILKQYSFGKLITNYKDLSPSEIATCIISIFFYLFSVYQNILTCTKFYYNMNKIHTYISNFKKYFKNTLLRINSFLKITNSYHSFSSFNQELNKHKSNLEEINTKLELITDFKINNFKKIFEIGKTLRTFYELYQSETYNTSIIYSFGFNGYLDLLLGIKNNINNNVLSYCKFEDNNNLLLRGNYYAAHKDISYVANDIQLKENMIITGPNASGKTTVLKSILLNILFSQQFGCGFYKSCIIKPFKYLWCYLNIPDTSGRDSLFQAEARRCKEIIDKLQQDPDANHFCIFDEIYSGTNPEEAIISAKSFVNYLLQFENTKFLLTTHYYKLTKHYKNNKKLINYHMITKKSDKGISYTYKIKKGISKVKGGLQVLTDLNYPKEMLKNN